MQPFKEIIDEAKKSGVEIKKFCSFCIESATGDLYMDDGMGNEIPIPVCESCLAAIQKKYSEKFDK
jgi:hypothetical protein